MISIIFFAFAGLFNSIMDIIYHKWNQSIFSKSKNENFINFSNPLISWKNKWENGDPNDGEKFIGSSTIFVMFTDLWHLSQFLMFISFILGAIFYQPIFGKVLYDIIILYLSLTLTFMLFYYIFFRK